MKRRLYILLIPLIICHLSVFGQSGLIFPSPEWNFGAIGEESGILTHRFVVRNTGEHPEVILEITAACGCTKPSFLRKPILPGEESVVEVTFQPAGQHGVIDRTLTVFGDRRQVVARLRVIGEVIPRKRTLEERFPVEVGKGIRLTNNHLTFGTVSHGEMDPAQLGIINTDNKPHRIRLVPQVQSGYLELNLPTLLVAGQEGEVVVGYTIPTDSHTYGTLKDTYYIEVDGERQLTRFATQAVAIDDLTTASPKQAPQIKSPGDLLRFGEVRQGETATLRFTLCNMGVAALIVRAVELPERIRTTLTPGERIPAGQSREYTLQFDSRDLDFGSFVKRLLVVTNDPQHPLWQPRISAIVIE